MSLITALVAFKELLWVVPSHVKPQVNPQVCQETTIVAFVGLFSSIFMYLFLRVFFKSCFFKWSVTTLVTYVICHSFVSILVNSESTARNAMKRLSAHQFNVLWKHAQRGIPSLASSMHSTSFASLGTLAVTSTLILETCCSSSKPFKWKSVNWSKQSIHWKVRLLCLKTSRSVTSVTSRPHQKQDWNHTLQRSIEMCLNLPWRRIETKIFPILSTSLCLMLKGKNMWPTIFWKLLKENPYSANGHTAAHMWQSPPTTWWNTLTRRTPSPPPLFSQTPVKPRFVRSVEWNSLWIMHMQCICTPTTNLHSIVIIVLSSFLDVREDSSKFTWNCAQPRAMVTPIARAHGETDMFSFTGFVLTCENQWLC